MKIKFIFSLFLFAFIIWFIYSASQPYTVNFSKDFYYDYESDSVFGNGCLVDIPPNIIDFTYDKKFVIIKQQPELVYIDYDRNSDYSYKAGLDETYYWIISLKEKKVYGPMLFDEYNILCKEKNIKLKFENNKFVNKNENWEK